MPRSHGITESSRRYCEIPRDPKRPRGVHKEGGQGQSSGGSDMVLSSQPEADGQQYTTASEK